MSPNRRNLERIGKLLDPGTDDLPRIRPPDLMELPLFIIQELRDQIELSEEVLNEKARSGQDR